VNTNSASKAIEIRLITWGGMLIAAGLGLSILVFIIGLLTVFTGGFTDTSSQIFGVIPFINIITFAGVPLLAVGAAIAVVKYLVEYLRH
jgi:hypothetical protein